MKRALVILVAAVIVGLLGWQIAVKVREGKSKTAPERGQGRRAVVAVEVAPVRKATIRDIGRFTGSLHPRSQFVVAPKVAGRLEKLQVDIGDLIRRGQLIATLDDDEYAQQCHQAQAELKVVEASVAECASALTFAKSEFVKAEELHEKKIASGSERDEAKARYEACEAKHKVALAQIEQRKAALKAAEVRLSYTKIHASWTDGAEPRVIGERFVDEGAMLRASDPIVSILDIHTLTAVIHVIERDYPRIQVGQPVAITTDAFPGRAFEGKVARIAPLLRESSRQAQVEVNIPNAGRLLKPGMFIRTRIEFAYHENARVVPVVALAKRDGRQGVFVVESDGPGAKARFVPVKLGIVTGELAEVIEPALAGPVVTLGHHLLETGSTVTLPGGGAGPTTAPASTVAGEPGDRH